MSRFASHRFSRFLMGILGITMVVAGIICARTLWPGRSAAQAPTQPDQPKPAVAIEPATRPAIEPLVTVTPSEAPVDGGTGFQPVNHGQDAHATENPAVLAAATTPPVAPKSLADAKALIDAGDLLPGRTALNDALIAGTFSPADAAAARTLIAQANATLICSPQKFPRDPFATTHTVRPGEVLKKIAFNYDVTWEFLARINGLSDPRRLRAGQVLKVIQGPFHAVVHKKDFTLDVYLGTPGKPGSLYVTSYKVGLGKDGSTPTGTWMVEVDRKIKNPVYYSPRGEGVIEANDPKNPLGEYWIGLVGVDGSAVGKTSYGIHGTIEPQSIGKQESMGCIRLLNDDVAVLFDLLVEGKSTVEIRE